MTDLQQKVLLAVLGALLAGWLFPAIARQSADRQKEIELKSELITELSQGARGAFSGARAIIRDVLPEAVDRREKQRTLAGEGNPSCYGEPTAVLQEFCSKERRAESERILEVRENWLEVSDGVEARVTAHFSAELGRDVQELAGRVLDYARLSFKLRRQSRADALGRLKTYLPTASNVDFDLLKSNPGDARRTGMGAEHADEWENLWTHMQVQMRSLFDSILDADGRGFSTNYGDLACDLLFFVPFTPGCEG
jgi:hypothetical protein